MRSGESNGFALRVKCTHVAQYRVRLRLLWFLYHNRLSPLSTPNNLNDFHYFLTPSALPTTPRKSSIWPARIGNSKSCMYIAGWDMGPG